MGKKKKNQCLICIWGSGLFMMFAYGWANKQNVIWRCKEPAISVQFIQEQLLHRSLQWNNDLTSSPLKVGTSSVGNGGEKLVWRLFSVWDWQLCFDLGLSFPFQLPVTGRESRCLVFNSNEKIVMKGLRDRQWLSLSVWGTCYAHSRRHEHTHTHKFVSTQS